MTDATFEGLSRTGADHGDRAAPGAHHVGEERTETPSFVYMILWWFAGVVRNVMQLPGCSTDWGRYAAQGSLVLLVALVGAGSMIRVANQFLIREILLLGSSWARLGLDPPQPRPRAAQVGRQGG